MKTKHLLLAFISLLALSAKAQKGLALNAEYQPDEATIAISLTNQTDELIKLYNSYNRITSGSFVQFFLKDKKDKEISDYETVFYKGVDYQRIVEISPRSTYTFQYPLKNLYRSSRNISEIHSVEARCFIDYSFPKRKVFEHFFETLTIKTTQDLTIQHMYDSHYQSMGFRFRNNTDREISVRNFASKIDFTILNQKGERLGKRMFPLLLKDTRTAPNVIKIAPKTDVRFTYTIKSISAGIPFQEITTIQAECLAIYDIPANKVSGESTKRTVEFKVK